MKPVTIDWFLSWALRDELPKRGWLDSLGIGNSFGSPSALGTYVSGGVVQPYAEMVAGGVHTDAVLAEQAIGEMALLRLAVDPAVLVADMPEIAAEGAEAVGTYRVALDGLVARMAMLAASPRWQVSDEDRPQRVVIRDERSGQPKWFITRRKRCRAGTERFYETCEEDGYDRVAKRPMPNAYRKYRWDPEPRPLFDMRYDWLAWRLALDAIAESLKGLTTRFAVAPSGKVRLPWSPETCFDAHLVKREPKPKSPPFAEVAVKAGQRAAVRLQQGDAMPLTAAGT